MSKKSLIKSGSYLSVMTLFSRVLGLVREMTKSAFLGTSALADAFSVAFMIPNLLRRLFAENSVTIAFIPTFKHYLEAPDGDEKKEEIHAFLSATFTVVSFATTLVVLLGIMSAPLLSSLFDTDIAATTMLTRIMFPYLVLISIAAFFQGILNSVRIFLPSGFTPILFNIIIISATYFLSPFCANPAIAMSIGVIVGGFVQAAFQLPFVLKSGFRFSFVALRRAFQNEGTKRVLRLIAPTIIGMAAYQLNDIASTMLAGRAGTGVVSSLQYSLRLLELILGVFVVSVSTVILPDLAEYAAKKAWGDFEGLLLNGSKIIALITIPATFFALVSGEHIIILIYKNRMFTDESVRLTLAAFQWHIAGLFFIALNRILAPAFYAQGDSKLPTLAGILSFAVNILLAMFLVRPMKGGGIALALSIAGFVNTGLLFIFLQKKQSINAVPLLQSLMLFSLKMIVFSILASVPLYFFSSYVYTFFAQHGKLISHGLPLLIQLCVFACIGITLLFVSNDAVTKTLIKKIRRR